MTDGKQQIRDVLADADAVKQEGRFLSSCEIADGVELTHAQVRELLPVMQSREGDVTRGPSDRWALRDAR